MLTTILSTIITGVSRNPAPVTTGVSH